MSCAICSGRMTTAAELIELRGVTRTLLAARLSLQFNFALVLTRGGVLAADVTEDRLGDREIRGHLDKVQVQTDDSLSRHESRVSILLTDGGRREGWSRIPKGNPENGLDWNEAAAGVALRERQGGRGVQVPIRPSRFSRSCISAT